jgi:hypothetical protein
MRQANVELRIEELVLYDQRHRIAAAIEQALARLLAERGLPRGYEEGMPPADLDTIRLDPNLTAESAGLKVAHSIYGQLDAGSRPAANPPADT